MDEGFDVVPADVARLAGRVLDGAGTLGDAAARLSGDASVPVVAFGSLASSEALGEAALETLGNGGTAAERLVATLEGDVDRLYQVAFAYQEAEEAAVRDMRRIGGPQP